MLRRVKKPRKKTLRDYKPWTPFEQAYLPPNVMRACEDDDVWLNNVYQVNRRFIDTDWGKMVHLSITRIDKKPIHDWRDLQRIKNELCGPLCEAMELYPAEARVIDTSNQYHLWVLPPGLFVPFGLGERLVTEHESGGSKQRPWPPDYKPNGPYLG